MSNTLTQTLFIYDSGLQAELQNILGYNKLCLLLPKLLPMKYCHGFRIGSFLTNEWLYERSCKHVSCCFCLLFFSQPGIKSSLLLILLWCFSLRTCVAFCFFLLHRIWSKQITVQQIHTDTQSFVSTSQFNGISSLGLFFFSSPLTGFNKSWEHYRKT